MPEGPIRLAGDDAPVEDGIRRRRRRRRLRLVLMLGGVLAVLAGSLGLWLHGGRHVGTDNAYVQADRLLVATDVSGIVARIAVREGEAVTPGQVLFELDPAPFRHALDGAEAALRQAALSIAAMQADTARMRRDIAAQEAAVALAQAQYERQAQLVSTSAVSRSAFDQARFGLLGAQQNLESLRAQLQVQLAKLGPAADGPVEAHPDWLSAQARVAEARRQLGRTMVRAPFAGVVAQVASLQPGQYLAAAVPAFALVSSTRLWVDAQPKETDLTHVKPGDPVEITVDTYPGRTWKGRVASISPASGATFSVLPAQNASGNWVKVVQRIPVRIEVEQPPEGGPRLRVGMSVEVSIDTGHVRSLRDLF
jgi:membrane fusion protein (multidrug efflux system)